MLLPLLPYIHLLPPYTPKSLFSSLTTLTPLLYHVLANAPFHFLSSLLFLITLPSSFPLSSLVSPALLLAFPTLSTSHLSDTISTFRPPPLQPWNPRPAEFCWEPELPDGTRQNPNICVTQLGPIEAPKDTQLYKQLVCKNASYAAKHRGPHQVAMKRNIINNDNNDRGNTLAWDVTVCLYDSGSWERWQRPLGLYYTHTQTMLLWWVQ